MYVQGRVTDSGGHVAALGDQPVVDGGVLEHVAWTFLSVLCLRCVCGFTPYGSGCPL